MKLEELTAGVRVTGAVPGEAVSVGATQWRSTDAVELTHKTPAGKLREQVLYRSDEARLDASDTAGRPFDADAQGLRLVAEAQRISLAGLFDPMLAVATSDVQPLPHQVRPAYGEMLDRTPLRLLLANNPGAGKTIMARLYLKVPAGRAFLASAQQRPDGAVDLDLVKELALLLFWIAEKNGWTKDGVSFNEVPPSWGAVLDASKAAVPRDVQEQLDYTGDEY